MSTLRVENSATVLGVTIKDIKETEPENDDQAKKTQAAALVGVLTTRTDNDTGSLTMNPGHGIITADRLDLFWIENGLQKHRRGMTVGTVAGNVVPIDLGSGDILPAASTAITAQVPVAETGRAIPGSNLVSHLATAQRKGVITITDGANAELGFVYLSGNDDGYVWTPDMAASQFTGETIAKIWLSNGDSGGTSIMRNIFQWN